MKILPTLFLFSTIFLLLANIVRNSQLSARTHKIFKFYGVITKCCNFMQKNFRYPWKKLTRNVWQKYSVVRGATCCAVNYIILNTNNRIITWLREVFVLKFPMFSTTFQGL